MKGKSLLPEIAFDVKIEYKPVIGKRVRVSDMDSLFFGEEGVIVDVIKLNKIELARIKLRDDMVTDRSFSQLQELQE